MLKGRELYQTYNEEYFERAPWKGGYKGLGVDSRWIAYIKLMKKLCHPPGCVLDVGCAGGHFVKMLRDNGYQGYGVDISHYALHHYKAAPTIILAHAAYLPYRDKTFDIVYSHELLEHIPEELALPTIKEFCRVGRHWQIHLIGIYKPNCFIPSITETGDPTHVNIQYEAYWQKLFVGTGWRRLKQWEVEIDNLTKGTDWAGRHLVLGIL